MPEPFPLVRRGYEPESVDAFLQEQADAWRTRLRDAAAASEDWKLRAQAFEERVVLLERRLKEVERENGDRIANLEGELAQTRWSRDQAQSELAEARRARTAAADGASIILEQARREAAQMLSAAEAETERWFAAARRRIEMAEAHAASRADQPRQ